jgi:hypothetical protein
MHAESTTLAPMAQTLYRIIQASEPTMVDFTSLEARGIAPRSDDPEIVRLNRGLSCWATEAQARRTARRFRHLGAHIADLQIPDDASVRIERTRGPGHYTVWGFPAELMTYVSLVRSV